MTQLPPAGAVFMEERRHRLYLWRKWAEGSAVMFVGLNPSTANEYRDDPTIGRCIAFAKHWGYGMMFMCNAFSLVSSDASVLKGKPLSELLDYTHDLALRVIRKRCQQAVVCWGNQILLARDGEGRAVRVSEMLAPVHCFGLTQAGQPRHPLYLRSDSNLETLVW